MVDIGVCETQQSAEWETHGDRSKVCCFKSDDVYAFYFSGITLENGKRAPMESTFSLESNGTALGDTQTLVANTQF
jgi:hypothetical protein